MASISASIAVRSGCGYDRGRDTFTGYFLYGVLNGLSMATRCGWRPLLRRCDAAARAADSIPVMAEVSQVLENEVFGQLEVKQW